MLLVLLENIPRYDFLMCCYFTIGPYAIMPSDASFHSTRSSSELRTSLKTDWFKTPKWGYLLLKSISPFTCQGSGRSDVSTMTLIKIVSSLIYVPFSRTVWATKTGQPDAMFISPVGFLKLLLFGSGLKASPK